MLKMMKRWAHLWTAATMASFFSFCSTADESCQKVASESAPAEMMVASSDATDIDQICRISINHYVE